MLRVSLTVLLLATGAASAQMPMPASGADTPATAAYRQAMADMMKRMDQPATGNPDRDFVAGMLPHHQGAIAMAEVELRYGHDPVLRRLARGIVASQSREVALMRGWLARHPAP